MTRETDEAKLMEQGASVEQEAPDLIVYPALGKSKGDWLTALLKAIGLHVSDAPENGSELRAAFGGTTAWITHVQPEELAKLAESRPDARFLLFFENAVDYLSPLLAQGERPDERFAEWSRYAGHLLAFLRRHRGRSMLLDYGSALENPDKLASLCGQFGIELTAPATTNDTQKDVFEVERWLVHQWLKGQEELDALEAELEASAHPLTDEIDTPIPSIENLMAAYADRVCQHQAALDESKEVAQTLQREVSKLTEQLATAEAEKQAEAAQRKQQAENDELAQENELLLLQLHQVQEELEAYFLENQKLREDGSAQSAETGIPDSAALVVANSLVQSSPKQQRSARKSSLWSRRVERKKLKKEIKLISESEWFDGAWYLEIYQDVAEAGMDPAEHYLRFGAAEGRNPSKRFDSDGYLAIYYDVKAAGMNPLVHYLRYGKEEGRALPPERPAW